MDTSTPIIERDPSVASPELDAQASAKTGAAWRLSYRRRGSEEPWSYCEAGDPQLDEILHRAGLRRRAAAPVMRAEED